MGKKQTGSLSGMYQIQTQEEEFFSSPNQLLMKLKETKPTPSKVPNFPVLDPCICPLVVES